MKNCLEKYKGVIIYILATAILVAIDRASKLIAVNCLKNKNPFVIIDGVFEFHYLENKGTIWGLMQGGIPVFIVITIIIVILVTWLVLRLPQTNRFIPMRIIAILITAGAFGNFIDRVSLGYVVDFIYFKLINFPIFNIADCYVTVSEILLIIFILFYYKEDDFKTIFKKEITNKNE